MKWLLNLFRPKPKPRMYPVPGEKKRRIEYKRSHELLFVILIVLISLMSCSPTASLPNGCTYKIHSPKFKK